MFMEHFESTGLSAGALGLSVEIKITALQKCFCHQHRTHLVGVDAIPGNVAGMADLAVILVHLLEIHKFTAVLI